MTDRDAPIAGGTAKRLSSVAGATARFPSIVHDKAGAARGV